MSVLWLASRRLAHRRLRALLLALALAAGGAVLGVGSVLGALAAERHDLLRLQGLPLAQRALQVQYRLPAGLAPDRLQAPTARAFASLSDVAASAARVRVWDPIAPPDERGVRLVEVDSVGGVSLQEGRLPRGCIRRVCEAVALVGTYRIGQRVPLGAHTFALVVGRGALTPAALPQQSLLGEKALVVAQPMAWVPLKRVLGSNESTVDSTAVLDPHRIHGYTLAALAERLRVASVRLERVDPGVVVTAPTGVLAQLAHEDSVSTDRLLLVAGEGAALILAFAAFAATIGRADLRRFREQLETLSGARWQVLTVRAMEALLPSLVGLVLALGGLYVAVLALAASRGYPGGFVSEALPARTVGAVVGLTLVGAAILFASFGPRVRPRFRLGPLELAALGALGLVAWQTASTGALDPNQIAGSGSGSPVVLLVPALSVFAAGVLLLRLLPPAFRLAERLARRAPMALRLALLTSARDPAQAAAATTLLAVALGSALFSLNYRVTLQAQARDAARFQAGARWRAVERGSFGATDVTPLTRYRTVAQEPPTPAIRLQAVVRQATGSAAFAAPITVLGLPAGSLPRVLGWRRNFAALTPGEISRRLRPRPVRLQGPRLADRARALRLFVQDRTLVPRALQLTLLLPGQQFERLPLIDLPSHWGRVYVELPHDLHGAELIEIGFPPTLSAPGTASFDTGVVRFGDLQEETSRGWRPLAGSILSWAPTPTTGTSNFQASFNPTPFQHAPLASGYEFDLNRTTAPTIRPALPALDQPLSALVSPSLARQAVDGVVDLDLLGQTIPVRAVATAKLFPTIVDTPTSFAVFDYDTLFAALNVDHPGAAPPGEAWFFAPQRRSFEHTLSRSPFRLERLVSETRIAAQLANDPLAAGTLRVLLVAALLAAALGLLGLTIAARSALAGERTLLAEYEALGVTPATLARSARYRLLVLSLLGLAAAIAGAALAVRLTAAFVAVTGTAGRPLPPILPAIDWLAGGILLIAVAAFALATASLLANRVLRESTAMRLHG